LEYDPANIIFLSVHRQSAPFRLFDPFFYLFGRQIGKIGILAQAAADASSRATIRKILMRIAAFSLVDNYCLSRFNTFIPHMFLHRLNRYLFPVEEK